MEKTFIPVTKYLVQFLNLSWGWESFEESVEDKEAANIVVAIFVTMKTSYLFSNYIT